MSAAFERGLWLLGIRRHNKRMPPPNSLTVKEAADEFHTTEAAIRKLIDRKRIKAHKVSGIWFIERAEMERVSGRKRGRPKDITKP